MLIYSSSLEFNKHANGHEVFTLRKRLKSTMASTGAKTLPYRLDGKVALVTGAGRGIGAEMALHLARSGAKVVVNYVKSLDSAQQVVQQIKDLGSDGIAIQADVSKVPDISRLFEEAIQHFGHLNIVCSNSGVVTFGHLEEVTEVCCLILGQNYADPHTDSCTGGIRPSLQHQHSWSVFCRAVCLQAPC
jgi:hypothetical protein